MKIAVVGPSPIPFTRGGAERLHNGLRAAIEEHTGHEAELIKLPSAESDLPELMASYRRFSELDLSHFDLVISSKYPGWMVPHPNHVIWVMHRLRGLYDTYHLTGLPTEVTERNRRVRRLADLARNLSNPSQLPDLFDAFEDAVTRLGPPHPAFAFPGPLARLLVHALDGVAFDPSRIARYAAISRTVAQRPGYFPDGAEVSVAVPPADTLSTTGGSFSHFFTASRLDHPKRLDLLIDAIKLAHTSVPLKIAGLGPEMENLRARAGSDPRVELLGYVTEGDLADLYGNALAVPFIPQDEDLGYIVLEAFLAGKPVITCTDSGGPTEFVIDGVTGRVCEPSAESLAHAFDLMAADPDGAAQMGRQGRMAADRLTWPAVVSTLLTGQVGPAAEPFTESPVARPPSDQPARRPGWPKLVVTSTFPIHPPMGGGQLRSFHLYGGLARHFDVEVVCLTGPGDGPARTTVLAPGLVETVVPRSPAHEAEEIDLTLKAEMPVTDVVAGGLIHLSPEYLSALRSACADAHAVILAHPYLYPAVAAAGAEHLPLIYDAHNAEAALKRTVLPDTPVGHELLKQVTDVEREATVRAALVTGCSQEDLDLLGQMFPGGSASWLLIPNGVDTRAVPAVTGTERIERRQRWMAAFLRHRPDHQARHVALFLGSWHPPNLDAATNIHRMAIELPHVLFLMAGSHCMNFDPVELPNNVAQLGLISDGARLALLGLADVALNPMTRGSGTNLKLVEYFAAGVPVVSTPLGARGLDVEDRVHCAVAEIESFPARIAEVVADPGLSASWVSRARNLVETDLDWVALADRMANAITTFVPGAVPGAAVSRR